MTLPTSGFQRPVKLVTGLARASTRWLQRKDGEAGSALESSLGELKGITMKLGQLLGYSRAQPLAFDRIRVVLEKDLGAPGRQLAAAMNPVAIAAGSLGQVHRATLPDGTPVAVKVQYPGIAATIARDLAPATMTGRITHWIYPRAHLHLWVGEIRKRVLEECDYTLEAQRQRRFRQLYANHPVIDVPAVHDAWCSKHVLTTGFAENSHPPHNAEAIFDFYVGSLFKHGIYPCDANPGNYLFNGKISFIDFGSTRELDPGVSERLWDLLQPLFPDEVRSFDISIPRTQLLRRSDELGLSTELPMLLRMLHGLSSALNKLGARANWYRRLHPEPPKPQLFYDVVLIAPGDSPIAVVRVLRDLLGMALVDARDLIDARGGVIKEAVPQAEAEILRQRLQDTGARVQLNLKP